VIVAAPFVACAPFRSDHCFADVGCPRSPAPIDCSAAERIHSLDEVLVSGEALLGESIHVRGPLFESIYACTIRGCRTSSCCNRCGAFLELVRPHPCVPPPGAEICLHGVPEHTLRLGGLNCSGDDSKKCCPFAALGQSVVVRGTLVRDSSNQYYELAGAALCATGTLARR
jgi:hypothetical protein